jgi:hypothetical protein
MRFRAKGVQTRSRFIYWCLFPDCPCRTLGTHHYVVCRTRLLKVTYLEISLPPAELVQTRSTYRYHFVTCCTRLLKVTYLEISDLLRSESKHVARIILWRAGHRHVAGHVVHGGPRVVRHQESCWKAAIEK